MVSCFGEEQSFWLDIRSGKKCFMLSERDLTIAWGDDPRYSRWTNEHESRFDEVAVLVNVCLLDICGKISTSMLSQKTQYIAYLVFKIATPFYGFHRRAVNVSVGFVGNEGNEHSVYLAIDRATVERDNGRQDGWFEIELGEFFNEDPELGELAMRVSEVRALHWKGGLVVQGIELRPKKTDQ